MWEFWPFKREKQVRNKEEISLQQFRTNNIGHRLAILAKNKDIIHTHSL
jgi:hypothetical protein